MRVVRILFGVALLFVGCDALELGVAANKKLDLQDRSRRSLDVGWLLRNLLLNSATASDLKANVTRTLAASRLPPPPPPTTRRPRTTRPPTTPAPPPPPPPFNPFFNKFALFASSSDLFNPTMRPTTTTTTTTTTTEAPETPPPPPPPPPPSRRPRPRPRPKPFPRPPPGYNRPLYGYDYDYFYPSGYDGSLSRGNPRFGPVDYDYDDASTAQSAPPPSPPPSPSPPAPPSQPSAPRKAARNRQRPAAPPPSPAPTQQAPPPIPQIRRRPSAASAPPPPPPPTRSRPPPQPQRDRLLYQYAQPNDTSFNESADDVDGPPEAAPEADIPPEEADDDSNAAPEGADATNGDVGDENEIPENDDDVGPPPEVLSPRLPSFGRRPNAGPGPSSPFASPSYYDAIPSSPYNFGSFNAGSGFGSSSFGFSRASPAKGAYKFRDAFSDFQTSYDGGRFQPSGFGSYK